jgi:phage tail sheath protein FI
MSILFSNFKRPGVKVVETSAGSSPTDLASFQTVYMIGSASTGAYNTPTLVRSLEDFTNQFSNSPSEASVKLYFRNDRSGLLYFVRSAIAPREKVVVDTATAGDYTLSIDGSAVTYTAPSSPTTDSIVSGLINAINTSNLVSSAVTAIAGSAADELIIVADDPSATLTVTVTTGAMTVTTVAATTPSSVDYVYSIEHSFDVDDDYAQGFLIAPEAYQLLTSASDRLAVYSACQNLVSAEGYDWMHLADCGPAIQTVAQLQAEAATYASPKGHSAYYAPYLSDLEDGVVPASAAVAGVATKRFKEQGFQQPMAGAKYPVQGVKAVNVKYVNQDQEVLNPAGVNVIRSLRNKGIVVWGMRTRSTDTLYIQTVSRVIMNVINGTLRSAFDNDLFTSIDGQAVLLTRIESTARAVLRRLWLDKALFGETEQDAFVVVCSFTNNDPADLQLGNVLVEVYAATSPGVERILVNTIKVPIGQVQESAQAGLAA